MIAEPIKPGCFEWLTLDPCSRPSCASQATDCDNGTLVVPLPRGSSAIAVKKINCNPVQVQSYQLICSLNASGYLSSEISGDVWSGQGPPVTRAAALPSGMGWEFNSTAAGATAPLMVSVASCVLLSKTVCEVSDSHGTPNQALTSPPLLYNKARARRRDVKERNATMKTPPLWHPRRKRRARRRSSSNGRRDR